MAYPIVEIIVAGLHTEAYAKVAEYGYGKRRPGHNSPSPAFGTVEYEAYDDFFATRNAVRAVIGRSLQIVLDGLVVYEGPVDRVNRIRHEGGVGRSITIGATGWLGAGGQVESAFATLPLEPSSERVRRYLGLLDIPPERQFIEGGAVFCVADSGLTGNALRLAQRCAVTEGGLLAEGLIRGTSSGEGDFDPSDFSPEDFSTPSSVRPATRMGVLFLRRPEGNVAVRARVTDQPPGNDLDLTPARYPHRREEMSELVTEVRARPADSMDEVVISTVTPWGRRTLNIRTLSDTMDTTGLADFILTAYQNPLERIPELILDLRGETETGARNALSVTVGDPVNVAIDNVDEVAVVLGVNGRVSLFGSQPHVTLKWTLLPPAIVGAYWIVSQDAIGTGTALAPADYGLRFRPNEPGGYYRWADDEIVRWVTFDAVINQQITPVYSDAAHRDSVETNPRAGMRVIMQDDFTLRQWDGDEWVVVSSAILRPH